MSGKKKNIITMISLLVLLALCLALFFVLPQYSSDSDEDTTSESTDEDTDDGISIDNIDEDDISTVTVEKNGKTVWQVQKNKKKWQVTGLEDAPVDSDTVSSILTNLAPVTATEKFSPESDDLSGYGLDDVSLTVKVVTDDETYTYMIGDEVPKSDMGYYAQSKGSDEIFCIESAFVTAFDVSQVSLLKMDELPEIDTDYMTYIGVDHKSGDDFAAKYVSDSEKVDYYSNWNIIEPYAKPLATSSSDWDSVLEDFSSLTYEEMVAYHSNNLKKYGLSSPKAVVTVKYYKAKKGYNATATATPSATASSDTSSDSDETYIIPESKRVYKTLKLRIGKRKGTSYYVCEDGSNDVYMMSATTVNEILELDAYTNMDHCVYSVLATSIKGYDVTYGDTTLKVTRKSVKKESDAEDDTETTATPTATATATSDDEDTTTSNETDDDVDNVYTLNGTTIDEDDENDFLKPYSQAYLLEYTETADDDVEPESDKPVLTIVYHENNRDVTVKYLPYDGTNFYRVDKDGMDYFLVDKMSVDDVIDKFKDIEKFAK